MSLDLFHIAEAIRFQGLFRQSRLLLNKSSDTVKIPNKTIEKVLGNLEGIGEMFVKMQDIKVSGCHCALYRASTGRQCFPRLQPWALFVPVSISLIPAGKGGFVQVTAGGPPYFMICTSKHLARCHD